MKLSEPQIQIIQLLVDQSKINISSLRDDVVDHLCCVVEHKMRQGRSFEIALGEAIPELTPYGLDHLQTETIFLLNSKSFMIMKKIMYIIGLFSAIGISVGFCFKILHWPGGDELFFYGFLTFALIYLPMLIFDRFKMNVRAMISEKLKLWLGGLSALLTGVSIVFKIFHLPGGDQLLLAGAGVFSFGFLPFLFFTMYKKSIAD